MFLVSFPFQQVAKIPKSLIICERLCIVESPVRSDNRRSVPEIYIFALLKAICSILCAYILSLAIMPCGDRSDCRELSAHRVQMSTTHQDHEGELEHCSPFCICACCGQLTSTPDVAEFMLATQPGPVKLFACTGEGTPLNVACKVWQPPKIS